MTYPCGLEDLIRKFIKILFFKMHLVLPTSMNSSPKGNNLHTCVCIYVACIYTHCKLFVKGQRRDSFKNLFQIFLFPTDINPLMKQTTESKLVLNCCCRKCKQLSINLILKVNCLIAHSFGSILQRFPITIVVWLRIHTHIFSCFLPINTVIFHNLNVFICHGIIWVINALFC